jgi:FkbH-like protein
MYEVEANRAVESIDQIPSEVRARFLEFRDQVSSRSVLPWSEHCTECVWPTCYSTCEFYSPREDGRCRRFMDGMVRLDCPGAVTSYLLKIRFKPWGKLWSPGNVRVLPLSKADQVEQRDRKIGSTVNHTALPTSLRKFAAGKRYVWKKRQATSGRRSLESADRFVIECYNPGRQSIGLSLTMRRSGGIPQVPFQKLIHVAPGFVREQIPTDEIRRVLDIDAPFSIELTPNDIAPGATLFFGLIDFVNATPRLVAPKRKEKQVKCVVWDLDNTLWSGILVEDGAAVRIKPGVPEILKELDRRGILHSVASKNNCDEAMAVLKRESLDEYFLYPQISWAPKSDSVKTIARKLNIGIDAMLFVDDSDFELAQVQSACPEVMTLRAERYPELLSSPVCQVPVTGESSSRRKMYREEAVRENAAENSSGDYLAFLRDCKIEMRIDPLSTQNLERVHELTQRTNQMNFSGNRYERKILEQIAAMPHLDTYVIGCQDRFGSYGIVGFSIVDSREPRMTDLMFSCRIQAKRVEHAFLAHLLRKYREASASDFWADWRQTPRNAPSGQVFQDIGMEQMGERDGVTSLVFPVDRSIPEDGIIRVSESLPIHVLQASSR